MRSSDVIMIHFTVTPLYVVWHYTLTLVGASYISDNVTSSFLSAKDTTVTAYLLELRLARPRNVMCCFQTTLVCLLGVDSGLFIPC